MSASQPASEQALLEGLMAVSAAFAALALLVWIATFLTRIVRLWSARRTCRTTEELTAWVLDQVARAGPVGRPPPLPRWKQRILSHVLRDLIAGTRGRDQERFIALLETSGLRAMSFRSVGRGSAAARQEAVEIIGHHCDGNATKALHGALDDADAAVRFAAARALLRWDQIDSLRRLLAKLRIPADDPPLAVADMLDELPARLQAEATGLLASGSLPSEWRRMLALALARKQVFGAYEAIAALRRSPEARLRAASWVALEQLGDPRAGDLLADGLRDPECDVRRAAARCAARLGGPAVAVALERLLESSDWWERHQAAEALVAIGSEGREALRRHLDLRPGDDAVTQAGLEGRHGD